MATVPHTPSPPSSPPEVRTPIRSGGSAHPWDSHNRNYYHQGQQSRLSFSPLTTPRSHFPAASPPRAPPPPSSPTFSPGSGKLGPASQALPLPAASPLAVPTLQSSPLFLKQDLESESWQTLYPSEIASMSSGSLRQKLTQSNNLLTRLSSSLSEARAQAAHCTFQHRLLKIETEEAMQRHQVENEIAKREVEVLRVVGTTAGGGGGGSVEYQRYCWALEEELAAYKRKLRRTKVLLREAREEIVEMKGENERLKKRIRENRVHRMRELGAYMLEGHGNTYEDSSHDDDTHAEERGNHYSYHREGELSHPPTPTSHQYVGVGAKDLHKNLHHNYQDLPTPRQSSSIGLHHLSSPCIYPDRERAPQTPLPKPRTMNNEEEDPLTTLGMLASHVLSQESFSEPHSPRAVGAQVMTRATTPVRSLSTTVPTTPLSQARNHPGPSQQTHKKSVTKTPKTPSRGAGKLGSKNGVSLASQTPGSKRNKSSAATDAALIATPKYTSPATAPRGTNHLQNNLSHNLNNSHQQEITSSPPHLLQPQGKKRRLSSDSTLSATGGADEAESEGESEEFMQELVRTGSPVPQGRKKGKVLGGSGYVYASVERGERVARWHKRTRMSSPVSRG